VNVHYRRISYRKIIATMRMSPAVAAASGLAALGLATPGDASELRSAAAPPPLVCKLPQGSTMLPAGARRGLIQHLRQYPDISLATPPQRRAASRVLGQLIDAAKDGNWRDLKAVARAGYVVRPAARKLGDRAVHYFHAEHHEEPGNRFVLNPRRPKALIYANAPGKPLALVGAMWAMRRGERGPTPGGPITRWHSHLVCIRGNRRGTEPVGGRCPAGARLRSGTEMLHVWFTGDLRSAFSTRAPVPELCRARLLDPANCP
jgi:hypothetical protein